MQNKIGFALQGEAKPWAENWSIPLKVKVERARKSLVTMAHARATAPKKEMYACSKECCLKSGKYDGSERGENF